MAFRFATYMLNFADDETFTTWDLLAETKSFLKELTVYERCTPS